MSEELALRVLHELESIDAPAALSLLRKGPNGGPARPKLRRIPAGTFTMGSPESGNGRFGYEGPQHEVRVSEFWMEPTPVTQAAYVEFDEAHRGERFDGQLAGNIGDHPVVNISWWEAFLYIRWRGDDCRRKQNGSTRVVLDNLRRSTMARRARSLKARTRP